MKWDGTGAIWRMMKRIMHLVAEKEAPTEFTLMANTSAESKVFDNSLCSKDCKKNTDSLNTSKDLDSLLKSQRLDKKKEGLGYSAVPPPPAQIYSSPKKDMSRTGLPEFKDDTVTDYSRHAPSVESSPDDAQNRNPFVTEEASPSTISPKSFIKFIKPNDGPTNSKTDKAEIAKKPPVKKRVKKGTSRSQNNTHKSFSPKPYRPPMRPDSGCSRHMIGNISYLTDYEPFDGGYVSFGQGGCKITAKGTIKTGKLEFENVYFVKDLKTPRQHNMYSIDLNNIVPYKDLTCLVAKASANECMLWHRRLGHLNFKTMHMLVRHNLVRGLPSKCFENNHTCTACLKGKHHKASCKSKLVNSVTKPLHTLHMDLFGPTSVSSISHKWYCLVVTDDFSRFTWTFFLKTKDETSGILRSSITEIENLKDLKVKIITKGSKKSLAMLELLSRMVCHVMFFNTLDHLGKFKAKGDEVETPIPTVSSLVPTACFTDSQEPSSNTRLILKRVANQVETPSVDNILTLTNRFEDILGVTTNSDESNGVEADVSNVETTITASPTPTLRIHKDHLKSQIIGHVDTPIQTRNKSKEVGVQSFIA
nr:hypothetical protein [Tanacetum cinerariifolium]